MIDSDVERPFSRTFWDVFFCFNVIPNEAPLGQEAFSGGNQVSDVLFFELRRLVRSKSPGCLYPRACRKSKALPASFEAALA